MDSLYVFLKKKTEAEEFCSRLCQNVSDSLIDCMVQLEAILNKLCIFFIVRKYTESILLTSLVKIIVSHILGYALTAENVMGYWSEFGPK